jgi:hypothetical protein
LNEIFKWSLEIYVCSMNWEQISSWFENVIPFYYHFALSLFNRWAKSTKDTKLPKIVSPTYIILFMWI